MREELERKLQEAFPFMQRSKVKGEDNAYQQWGCQCGDGWFVMLCSLCREITDRYAQDNQPIDLVVEQVKEKFGRLKFYISYEDVSCTVQAHSFSDGKSDIRFHQQNKTIDEHKKKLRKDITQIIRNHESKSTHVCEVCGSSGEIRKMSWQRTLCDNCYDEYIKRHEAQKKHS